MRAQIIKLFANLPGQHPQIARIDAHAPKLGSCNLNGRLHALSDVIRIHQQCRRNPQRLHLRAERRLLVRGAVLVDVHQRPRMRGRPRRRNAVAVRRLQVRRRVETSQVRRPRRRHRRIFMRATRPHLNQRAAIGSRHHTGSRRGYRRIRIHDGQNHRLQDHALGKRAAHRQDRRMRKI